MNADMIKEFLVGLGFKVDTQGLKVFTGTIESCTKAALSLGIGVAAAATATVAAVEKVSEKFEDLYYASVRIKASVGNIQAYRFALGQVGGTADGAMEALESVSSFIRSNPGGEKYINSLGVETRKANGDLRDMTNITGDLGKRFKEMPFYLAKYRAAALGINDDKTLMAMMRDSEKFQKQNEQMWKSAGIDQDEAAKKATLFMNAMRHLTEHSLVLATVIAERLAPAAYVFIGALEKLIDLVITADHYTDGWSTRLGTLAAGLFIVTKAMKLFGVPLSLFIGIIPRLLLWLAVLTETALPALSAAFLALGAAIEATPIGWIITGIVLVGIAVYELWKHLKDIGQVFSDLWARLKASPLAWLTYLVTGLGNAATDLWNSWKGIGPFFSGMWNGITGVFQRGWESIRPYIVALAKASRGDWAGALGAIAGAVAGFVVGGVPGAKKGADEGGRLGHEALQGAGAAVDRFADSKPLERAGKAVAGAAEKAMAFFQGMGWTQAQAAGITANLHSESGLNPQARGDGGRAAGIGQWHPDRQKAFAEWAGFKITDPRATFEKQLAFVNFELTKGTEKFAGNMLRATKDAFSAGAVVSRHYERPADTAGEMNKRGKLAEQWYSGAKLRPADTSKPVHIVQGGTSKTVHEGDNSKTVHVVQHNKTDIHVHGSGSASDTAKAVKHEQSRVQGDAVRNLKGAVS